MGVVVLDKEDILLYLNIIPSLTLAEEEKAREALEIGTRAFFCIYKK